MSKINIELAILEKDLFDEDAIIGYDDEMETWFLQAFEAYNEEEDVDEPTLWLGLNFQEYSDVNQLISCLERKGITFEFSDEKQKERFESECKKLNQIVSINHEVF